MSTKTIDTVLLLALPASGKSEVRKYLDSLSPTECLENFHIGQTVQLDDYPYVHLMRCIDDAVTEAGGERIFFKAADEGFQSPLDWGTLIELLNEDYEDLVARRQHTPKCPLEWLLGRYEAARAKVGAKSVMQALPEELMKNPGLYLREEAEKLLRDKNAAIPDSLAGKTVVIEFARGGSQGATLPLGEGYGYAYSLARLSTDILAKAAILYIWVTPEESRRKNNDRADPNNPGSILNHGVPLAVMLGEYGQDDMEYLLGLSDRSDTVMVNKDGRVYHLPVGRFDNRVDKTSFIRGKGAWAESDVARLRAGLNEAFARLLPQYTALHD